MKNQILILITAMTMTGCYYPHKLFKSNTGLEFSKEVNLCPGAGVESQRTCKPTSDGWKKAKRITGATLEPNDTIFKRIVNDYLLQRISSNQITIIHNYNLWGSALNNPKSPIALNDTTYFKPEPFTVDYIVEPFNRVPISELYEKDAVTSAISTLEAEAELNDVSLSADFVLNVKSELQRRIKNSKSTDLTFYFIQAEYKGLLAAGEDDNVLSEISELSTSINQFQQSQQIVTGISGILFSNLKAKQTVVEESMLTTSIDASLTLVPEADLDKIENLKLSASTKWSNTVNENINTSLSVIGTGTFFYPLWIKTTTKK